jgi:Zn-dependent peptidase ImmA (M78 family)/transcriptional regulator with XRE-family HTH domain
MAIGERLKHARDSLNLTLYDVESRTQIGVSTLSEFENNKREPKLVQLKSLADLYGRPMSFFLEEGELAREVVLWRERPTSPRAEELQVRLLTLAEQYHNLEVWCEDRPDIQLPMESGDPGRYDYPDAEALAHRVRNLLGLGERPGQTLLRVLEEVCKVKVFHLAFEPTGSAASTLSSRFGAAVLLNAKNVRWRRNFDLAHELFHLLTWRIFRQAVSDESVEPTEQEEGLAGCFASVLLMPQEAIVAAVNAAKAGRAKLGFDDLFEVARQFDVSIDALLWRMKSVYRIPPDKVHGYIESFRGQMSYWDDRQRDDPPSRPLRFRALARHALRKGMISAGRYAEYLGISRREAMQVVEQDAGDDAEVEVAYP